MLDLFGENVKKIPFSKGYAGTIGMANNGKFCKHCKHIKRIVPAKKYFKCDLINYTRGKGTDIKANAPACEFYEMK